MDAIKGKNVESVAMLSLSKHWRAKASPRVLRQPQDDTRPAKKQSVIARYEAISELYRFAYIMHEQGCHAEPVEAWWAKASPRVLRQAQDDTQPAQKQSVIARYEAISELYRSERRVTDNIVTCLCRDCFVPRNEEVVKYAVGFLICLFMSVNCLSQIRDTLHKDTSKKFLIRDVRTIMPTGPLIVIDGQYYEGEFKNIDPGNVLDFVILKGPEAQALYGVRGSEGVIVLSTRLFEINQYKQKFSNLSKKYRAYILNHNNEDKDIGYILNGIFLDIKSDETIKTLYKLSIKDIKTLDFIENPFYNGVVSKKYLAILQITKQQH